MDLGKIVLVIVLFFAVFPFATAVEYRQDTPITLGHAVRLQGHPTSTALCNLTLVYMPESLTLIGWKQMVYNATTEKYEYFLTRGNQSLIGEYCYDVTCMDSGLNQTNSYCYEVSPTGVEYTIAQSLTYFFVLILSISLLGVALLGSVKIPFKNVRNRFGELTGINYKKYGKIFMIVMSYLILMWIFYITYNISLGYLQLGAVATFFKFLYLAMLSFTLPSIVVVIIVGFVIFIEDLKVEKMIERGLTVE